MNLNAKQLEAVNYIEGPLLVLAGAGAGKTRVVTKKISKLVQIGIPSTDILALTFTNKAADEMAFRVRKEILQNVLTATFHSLGVKILRESIYTLDYSSNFIIYDEEDSLKLLKECFNLLKIKDEKSELKKIKYKISSLKNDLLEIEDPINLFNFDKNEISILHLYQKSLKNCNAVDFDDLLYLPVKLFKKHPEILEFYQKKWPFLLIDEYQDTNFAQYTISKLLSLRSQNICAVGDPDQSIYSWRGAKYQNILNFDKDFPNAKIILLEQNYRSTQTILNASNAVIKKNENRYEKNLFSNLEKGEKITIFIAESDHLEASFVVEKILKYHRVKKIPLNEMVIFYRTNFQSRIFEDILLSQKIPYIIYGGISFYQRKEIKDILAYLKLIVTDNDFLAFNRTINTFKKGFGKATLNKLFLLSESKNIPILQLLKLLIQNDPDHDIKLNIAQRDNVSLYLQNIEKLRNLYSENLSLDELISEVINIFDYFTHIKEDIEKFEDRKQNIDEFITKAYEFANENQNDLKKFLEDLSLMSSTNKIENEKALKLMTLHNSKGLEFEIVFIVGLEEDLFPHINSKNSMEELEEERRLFYVGMTRAKKKLYLAASEYRFLFGATKISTPSRFLKEIPEIYLENLSENITYHEIEKNEENLKFYPGLKVEHKTFGNGIVQKVYEGSLGETLDVLFEKNITRSLVTKYAKLKILN